MNKGPSRANSLGLYALIAFMLLGFFAWQSRTVEEDVVLYSDVRTYFEQELVREVRVEGTELLLVVEEAYLDEYGEQNLDEYGKPAYQRRDVTYDLRSFDLFFVDLHGLVLEQFEAGIIENFDYTRGWQTPWWMTLIPYLFIIVLFFVVWYFIINRAGGGGGREGMRHGKIKPRLGSEMEKKVLFSDVAGADEEKEELQEIVEYLKDPSRYTELGARIPKGVILVGPPGTGKTLIAKAVAGEAGVQFLSISGSDFVELYVGVGASRVRDLFDQAKKAAPCIIFIDEIDAVGRQRGAGMGGGHDEREQTLNQLLVEMDGFGTNMGVIVMAATNRKDILDAALLRPGRFDRQVYVGLPDVRGREAILKVHARGKPLGDDVDLGSIARGTPGFSGADLENLLNEAALLAARRHLRFITMAEVEEAVLKVMMGPEKKSRVVTEKARKLTAYHEAGHAVSARYLESVDPVHQITIVPRGGAGGMTVYRPQEDKSYGSKKELFERIVSAMGGRVAEKIYMDDISTGAVGDIQQATAIARAMVMQYGMSEKVGPISYDSSGGAVFIGRDFAQTKSYSEKVAAEIDEEIKRIFDEAMEICEKIIREHDDIMKMTADYLLENEVMDGNVFDYLCEHGEFPPADMKKASMFERMADERAESEATEPETAEAEDATEPEDDDYDDGWEEEDEEDN
ncbi:MAG: ATP-dependent zinc metalloprotease FtsH [Oscillospiraceae bacterium]|nr:ATP-dependent zinc metalloprotease FtsH [Oscillospiraceae bacterium]